MKLSEIEEYIIKNNIQKKYNYSLNKNGINSASNTFYSAKEIEIFFNNNIDSFSYINYYNFLSKSISKGKPFLEYLKEKVDDWMKIDENINKKDAIAYLLKVFVIDPVNGKEEEVFLKESLKKRFPQFTIIEPTPNQDYKECWDLKLKSKEIEFCIQHKPKSFFYAINTTAKNSFNKIKKASINYNNDIFLTKISDLGQIEFYIRDKNKKNQCNFVSLNNFKVENLKQNQIKKLAKKTFLYISNNQDIKKNNRKL